LSPGAIVRVGAVSYLNSKPLIEDLPGLLPEANVSLDYPSRLADQLSAGDLDVALIPSVEYMRGADYEIISDACVATRGPVLSVKLYSRVDPGAIQTLALDEGSRTSATLARIMLLERYGVDPARKPLPIEMPTPCWSSATGLCTLRRKNFTRCGISAKSGLPGRGCRLCSRCGSLDAALLLRMLSRC
jgi:chorismate dehydratase